MSKPKLFSFAIGILVGCLLSFICHKNGSNSHFKPNPIQFTIKDTIKVLNPLEIDFKVVDVIEVPREIVVRDTICIHDTLYLPREQRVYEGRTYKAWVSGYLPRLDSIYTYKPKWSIGIQAGIGLVVPINNAPTLGGYLGVGVTYVF